MRAKYYYGFVENAVTVKGEGRMPIPRDGNDLELESDAGAGDYVGPTQP